MRPNPVAENVLGTMGTICWAGQLIPQVWKNYRDKKTFGLSPWLMLIWGISSIFLGAYAILQHLNIPLQLQPQLFGFLTLLSWGQCLYYNPAYQSKKWRSVLLTIGTMALVGGLEVLLVFVSRPAYERGVTAPVQLFGILAVVTIAGGLLPQYWEIYVLKEVKGVSYTFIVIDMLGGLLNDLSLAFASEFDALAAASYTLVIVMDSVIIIAAIILNPRARKRRRLAAEAAAVQATNDNDASSPETAERGESGLGTVHLGSASKLPGAGQDDVETKYGIDGHTAVAVEDGNEKNVTARIHGVPMRQVDSDPPSTVADTCISSTVVEETNSVESGHGGMTGSVSLMVGQGPSVSTPPTEVDGRANDVDDKERAEVV